MLGRHGVGRGEPPEAGRTTVLLARHGRTVLNAQGRLRGRLDPELDDVGWDQARALGEALAPYGPQLVVTSPLLRAVQTGDVIADRCSVRAEVMLGFVDRDYGGLTGARQRDVVERWGSVDAAPGVEPAAHVVRRATLALGAAAAEAEGSVVVVSHDAVNRLLIAALDPDTYPEPDHLPQETGCFNVLGETGAGWQVRAVGVVPRPLPA